MFYFMSVHIEVVLDSPPKKKEKRRRKKEKEKKIHYINLPTGQCTINLTIEMNEVTL